MSEDFEREPSAGGDPTRTAPGVGPHEADPVVMAKTEPAPVAEAPRATNAGRVWIALGIATVLLILLIIFIAENAGSVTISFLGAHGRIALALALLIAAVAGAVVTLLAGTARILQLRLEVRRNRRGGMTRGHRLQPH